MYNHAQIVMPPALSPSFTLHKTDRMSVTIRGYSQCLFYKLNNQISHFLSLYTDHTNVDVFMYFIYRNTFKMRRVLAIVLVMCIILSLLHERYDYPRLDGSIYLELSKKRAEKGKLYVLPLCWRYHSVVWWVYLKSFFTPKRYLS